MAAIIPLWLVGRHVTAFTLTPQTVNTTSGALTDTTPVATMYGHLKNVQITRRNMVQNISAMDRDQENNIIIERGTTFRCTEHLKSAGVNLGARAYGNDYHKLVVTRGEQSYTAYGVVAEWGEDISKPGGDGGFTLAPIDTGTATPSVSYG